MKHCMYHVKPILHHVKACHRFVDHTVKLEKAFEVWAMQYASSALQPYVEGDIRAGEAVWAACVVAHRDPDVHVGAGACCYCCRWI